MSLSLGEIRRKAMPFECLECPLKVIMMRPERGIETDGGLCGKELGICSFIRES